MKNRILHNILYGTQPGITALETAIILIAFVVVAAVFTFTVLYTGQFIKERAATPIP